MSDFAYARDVVAKVCDCIHACVCLHLCVFPLVSFVIVSVDTIKICSEVCSY